MSKRFWTRELVCAAIRKEAQAGHDLCYSAVEKRVPALLRAAQRLFSSWAQAVKATGYDYDSIRRYRVWSRDTVIEKIREWRSKGADLSWRNVSLKLDPPLAAAALHAGRFASWNEALQAAGIDPEEVRRYRRWTREKLRKELAHLSRKGIQLSQDSLAATAPALLAAIYRTGAGLLAEREAINRQLAFFASSE